MISWQAPEFEYRAKTILWYWLSIFIAVVILAAAVWLRNFLFGIFMVIAEILILVWANREPRILNFALTEQGLQIGARKFEPYNEIESFSVLRGAETWTDIMLRSKRRLRPVLHLLVPSARLTEIEGRLKTLLPEEDYQESFIETLERILRF